MAPVRPHEFTYQPESDTSCCPAGQTLARKQLMRKDRTVLYAATTRSLWSLPSEIAMHRVAATIVTRHLHEEALQRMQNGPRRRRLRLRRATVEHPFRQFENTASSDIHDSCCVDCEERKTEISLARSRLQSETHGEYSRRTQATCSSAGHLILLLPVITRRQRTFASPKQKSDASGTRNIALDRFFHSRFVTV